MSEVYEQKWDQAAHDELLQFVRDAQSLLSELRAEGVTMPWEVYRHASVLYEQMGKVTGVTGSLGRVTSMIRRLHPPQGEKP